MKLTFLLLGLLLFSNPLKALDYYWVGGSGNWSDLNNWVTTSGGTTNHTQVPTSNDDVYFDANSFNGNNQTVTINVGNATCKDMIWTGATNTPTITAQGNNNLRIHGSLLLIENMNFDFDNNLIFEGSSTGNDITLNSNRLGCTFTIDGIGGGWVLQDSLILINNRNIEVINGSFNTNGEVVICNQFNSNNANNTRTINLGNSEIYVNNWNINARDLTFNAGNSAIHAANNFLNNLSGFGGNPSISYREVYVGREVGFANLRNNNNQLDVSIFSTNFVGNTTINGPHTHRTMNFPDEGEFRFQGNVTQTIQAGINADGSCIGSIRIISTGSLNATFQRNGGSIVITRVYLEGMSTSGSTNFLANSSIDGGDNSGWTIFQPSANNMYWIGGSGDWSDPDNWSQSSGGTAGDCIPTQFDNAVFDDNSFTSTSNVVTIDIQAECRNLDWTDATNSPTLQNALGFNNLSVFGDLLLIRDMNMDFERPIIMRTSLSDRVVQSSGKTIHELQFEGSGSWELADSLRVRVNLRFRDGTFNTTNEVIDAQNFLVSSIDNLTLNLGSSEIFIRRDVNIGASFNSTININAGTSHFILTGADPNNNLPRFTVNHNQQSLSFHDLSFTNPSQSGEISTQNTNTNFNDVFFASNGTFLGNNTFEDLTLSAGKAYFFEPNRFQTINGDFNATGDCKGLITLRSTIVGQQGNITKSGSNVVLDFVSIKDLAAQGSPSFTANNAKDLGNNTNWNINSGTNQDFYWINDSGNWHDTLQWSFSSGGTSAGCLPTAKDNVIFDQNSFSGNNRNVNISDQFAFCNNMDWRLNNNNVALNVNDELYINGSLWFNSNINLSQSEDIVFEGNTDNDSLLSAGITFTDNIIFQKDGSIQLMDKFTQSAGFTALNVGGMSTNGFPMELNDFRVPNVGNTALDLDTSSLEVAITFSISGSNLNLNADSATLRLRNMNISHSGNLSFKDVFFDLPGTTSRTLDTDAQNNSSVSFRKVFFAENSNANIRGQNTFEILEIDKGSTVRIGVFNPSNQGNRQTINQAFLTNGDCINQVILEGINTGVSSRRTEIQAGPNLDTLSLNFVRMSFLDAVGNATYIAENSDDIEDNNGWIFPPRDSLTLYWVNGSGNWDDENQWSFESGGQGGACIPSRRDLVVFDSNSFTANNQSVTLNINEPECHTMDWRTATFNPTFNNTFINSLNIYGSLYLTPDMNYNINRNLIFRGGENNLVISTAGNEIIGDVRFLEEDGVWTLLDDLTTRTLFMEEGHLNTNGQTVDLTNFRADLSSFSNRPNITLSLGSSTINVSNLFRITVTDNLNVNPGTSNINLTATNPTLFTTVYNSVSLNLNNVNFLSNTGTSTISRLGSSNLTINFGKVRFNNNGLIFNGHSYDTLLFTPSNTYEIEANTTQTINDELLVRGNGCFPITIRSTSNGTQSTFSKSSGRVSGEYLELRDQRAQGGAAFYAGDFSTDVNNNTGWTFDADPNARFGFAIDTAVCPGDTITLTPDNFNLGSEFDQITWPNNSTANSFQIFDTGQYAVRADFTNNCFLTDTINIGVCTFIDSIKVVPTDVSCHGADDGRADVIVFGGAPPFRVAWSNQAVGDSVKNLAPGNYSVTATGSNNFQITDSFEITEPDPLAVELSSSQLECVLPNEAWISATAEGGITPYTYDWSPGQPDADSVAGLDSGLYRLNVIDFNGCEVQDSVFIPFADTFSTSPIEIAKVSVVDSQSIAVDFSTAQDVAIESYVIYAAPYPNSFEAVDTLLLPNDTTWTYLHEEINPAATPYQYKIIGYDSCFIKSSNKGRIHKSIRLLPQTETCENRIELNWNAYEGWDAVDEYRIVRSDEDTTFILASLGSQDSFYIDTQIADDRIYCYQIEAIKDGDTLESRSNGACLNAYSGVPPLVLGASKTASDEDNGTVELRWKPQLNDPLVDFNNLYFKSATDASFSLLQDSIPLNIDSFVQENLNTKGENFAYYFTATDTCGNEGLPGQIHQTMLLDVSIGQLLHELNWTPYQGFDSLLYLVERFNGIDYDVVDTVENDTTTALSPAPCNFPIYYRISAIDSEEPQALAFSDTAGRVAIDSIPPDAPTMKNVSHNGNGLIEIDFDGSPSTDIFAYDIMALDSTAEFSGFKLKEVTDSGGSFSAIDTFFILQRAQCYKITALDSCLNATPSAAFCPIDLTLTPINQGIQLNWSAFEGYPIQAYEVEKLVSGNWTLIATLAGSQTIYVDSGLVCNTLHTYRIKGTNANDQTIFTYSNEPDAVVFDSSAPASPEIDFVSVLSHNELSLQWQLSDGKVDRYEVQLQTNGNNWEVKDTVGVQTSYLFDDLNAADNQYCVRIVAIDSCADNRSLPSSPHCPVKLAGNGQNLQNSLTWSDYEGFSVENYVVENYQNDQWVVLDTLIPSENDFIHENLPCNVPEAYRIKALGDNGLFVTLSDSLILTPFDTIPPARPEIDFVSVLSHNELSVQWQLSDGKVDRYEVQLQTNGNNWEVKDTVGVQTSYLFDDLNAADNQYCVRMVAIDSCADNRSLPSSPHCPVKLAGNGQNLQNSLSWSDYEGFSVENYVVENYQNDQWVVLDTLNPTENDFIHENLPCNVPEAYRIKALADNGLFASLSDSLILTPFDTIPPASPEIDFVTVLSHNELSVQWQLSDGKVDRYELQLQTNGNNWEVKDTVGVQTSYLFDDLNAADNQYCVRMVAIDSCADNRSLPSSPHCPVKLAGNGQNLQNSLSWSDYEGFSVNNYVVENYQNDQWVVLDTLNPTENDFIHENLPCNVPEAYRIKALDNNGLFASLSDSLVLTPFDTIPPSQPNLLLASVNEPGTIDLQWEVPPVGGAKFYEIWGKPQPDSSFRLLNTNVYDTTFVWQANTRSDAWQFFVIAIDSCDADNRSIPSDTHQIMVPETPLTGDCFAKANLSWSPYVFFDNQTYAVERSLKNQADFEAIAFLTDTFFVDTNVADENQYCYRFRAFGTDLEAFSDTVCMRPFTFPRSDSARLRSASVLTTGENEGQIEISWDLPNVEDPYLQAYEIFHKAADETDFQSVAFLSDSLTSSFLHTNINTQAVAHQYFIKTWNICEISNSLADTHQSVKIDVQALNLGALVEWSAYQGFEVNRYEVQRSLNDFDFRTLGSLSPSDTLFWVDSTQRCDQLYAYRILAFDAEDEVVSVFSDTFAFVGFDTLPPQTPEIQFLTVTDAHHLAMEWDNIEDGNRKGFYIFRLSGENAPPQLIDSVMEGTAIDGVLRFQDSLVDPGQQPYIYQIAAFDSCGNVGDFSPQHAAIHLQVNAESELNTLNWTAYVGWENPWTYQVERKELGGNWEILADGLSGLQYLDEYPACDLTHIYRIRATHEDGRSVFSNRDTVNSFDNTPPDSVKLTHLVVENPLTDPNKEISLHWESPEEPDVVGIELFKNQRFDIRYQFLAEFETTELQHNITYDSINFPYIYCYVVALTDECGNTGNYGNKACIMTLEGEAENGSNTIRWEAYHEWEADVAAYEVFRSDDGADFISLGTTTETSFTDEELTPHITDYCYYVEAIHPEEAYRPRSTVKCLRQPAIVHIPNAFTPGNQDELNDFFEPGGMYIKEFDLQIYDRWGAKIFEVKNAKTARDNFGQGREGNGWDGYYNGEPVPEGVYIYKMTIRGVNGERIHKDGNLTIVY